MTNENAAENLAEVYAALTRVRARTPATLPVQCEHSRCFSAGRTIPDVAAVTLDGEVLCPRHGFERAWAILDEAIDPRATAEELREKRRLIAEALDVTNASLARIRTRLATVRG